MLVLIKYPVWALGFIQIETSPRYKAGFHQKLIFIFQTESFRWSFSDHSIQTVKQYGNIVDFQWYSFMGMKSLCARL